MEKHHLIGRNSRGKSGLDGNGGVGNSETALAQGTTLVSSSQEQGLHTWSLAGVNGYETIWASHALLPFLGKGASIHPQPQNCPQTLCSCGEQQKTLKFIMSIHSSAGSTTSQVSATGICVLDHLKLSVPFYIRVFHQTPFPDQWVALVNAIDPQLQFCRISVKLLCSWT